MCLRAVWVVSKSPNWQIVFSRLFSTIEKQARKLLGDSYVEIPFKKKIIVMGILQKIGLDVNSSEAFTMKDSCSLINRIPVIGINLKGDGYLWPIVLIEHCGSLLCALCLVEKNMIKGNISSLLEINSVSTAFSVLLEIQKFLGAASAFNDKLISELNKYISKTIPFGRPSEMNSDTVKLALQNKSILIPHQHKVPSQNPQLTSKPKCIITVSEYVRCNQYNKQLQGIIDLYGTIAWKGFLENINTEITLTLSSLQNSIIEPVAIHPSVSHTDPGAIHSSASFKKLRFLPSSNFFMLCYYTIRVDQKNFPIYGSYKMRYENHAEFLIQLNLNKNIKNNFDFCEVFIPLQNNHATNLNIKPTWGCVSVSNDKKKICWSIGQKFPNKLSEISLEGTFTLLKQYSSSQDKNSFVSNSYASLSFCIPNYTFSGCEINSKNVQTSPVTKTKISCEKEFHSSEYVLWNSYGSPPVGFRESQIRLAEDSLK